MKEPQPIFLLADSQLLFWKNTEGFFLQRVADYLEKNKKIENIKAAYLGASNGDNPIFYDLFINSMGQIGISNSRMIPSQPTIKDVDFLRLADLILLAGGDVKKGLDVLKKNGCDKIITERYHNGGIIIGISAGAIQLGLKGWDNNRNPANLIDTFKIVPYVIDVHNETNEWKRLEIAVENEDDYSKGFGIPYGGGAIFYPDWSIEAVCHPLTEVVIENDKIKQSIIIPFSETQSTDNKKWSEDKVTL